MLCSPCQIENFKPSFPFQGEPILSDSSNSSSSRSSPKAAASNISTVPGPPRLAFNEEVSRTTSGNVSSSNTSPRNSKSPGKVPLKNSWEANNYLEEVTHRLQTLEHREEEELEDQESKNVNIENDSLTENYQDDSLVVLKEVEQIKLESLDSLQRSHAKVQPDSLSYDEDTFEQGRTVRMPPTSPLEYYDSISSVDLSLIHI